MLIAVYSMGHVVGAEVWALIALVCALLYMGVCCLFRYNRSRQGMKRILLGLLAAEAVYDVACAVILYPGGEYHNYGLGSAYMVLFIWFGLLAFSGLVLTGINAQE